jgi:hypothetical protein
MADSKSTRMTPPDIACSKCGMGSKVHAIHYIYKKYVVGGHVQDNLSSIVTVIECPGCGVLTQTESMDETLP